MLKKENRLILDRDFSRVFSKGKSFWGEFLGIRVARRDDDGLRFGFVISNKISKKATVRNRIKRQLREAVRINLDQITKGYDVAVMVNSKIIGKKYQELEPALIGLLKKSLG